MRSVAFRLWLALVLATAFQADAQTYPGSPVLTVAGASSCGARLYAAGQVQTYCVYLNPPNPAQTVCNALDVVLPSPGPPSKIDAAHNCFIHDSTGTYEVTWLYWQAAGASTISYQIATMFFPLSAAPPTTAFQSGTF